MIGYGDYAPYPILFYRWVKNACVYRVSVLKGFSKKKKHKKCKFIYKNQ